MLAILVSRGNWKTIESDFLGEVGELKACEVETAPECDYEDITETDTLITQRCLNGKYGEELTYENIVNIRSLITEVGDASSYNELLKKKIDMQEEELTDAQLALVELYEEINNV